MPTKRDPRAPCRPDDPPSLHEKLIRGLIASDARMCRNGFWRAIKELSRDWPFVDLEWAKMLKFVPDAFLIDHEAKRVLIYEVEITSPLSEVKLDEYAWFWFLMDAESNEEWLPELNVVDRYSHRNELDLQKLYYERLIAPHAPAMA